MISVNIVICGDFNIWIDDENDRSAIKLTDIMASFGLSNNVSGATSISGHTLDLIFSDPDRNCVRNIEI